MKRFTILAALLATSALVPGVALAQGASKQANDPQGSTGSVIQSAADVDKGEATQTTTAAEGDTGDVVVTGSRVITNGNNSPTPVTTVTYDTLQTSKPGTLYEGLNQLPIFAGSRGQNSNPSVNGGVGGGNGAASQLNLRNVGATRTLVLMDGHRVPPTLFSGITDMDIIPQNVIQRVDAVTGGVSAVYGSDAVTGVINFITDRKFNGIKGGAQYGESKFGDGQQYSANLAFGHDLGDRAHILLSYEYRKDDGVDRKTVRPWFQFQSAGNPGTVAAPYYLITGARSVTASFTGITTIGGVRYNFSPTGTLAPLNEGTAVNNLLVRIGGDGVYSDNGLKAGLESHQFYARVDVDLTDDIHLSTIGLANLKTNTLFSDWVQLNGVTLSTANPYLTAQARALLPAAATQFNVSRYIQNYDYRYNPVADTHQYYTAATLDGKVGKFDWQVYAGYGSSQLDTTVNNNPNREKLAAALDAVSVNGTIQCSTVAIRPDCVPINVFGAPITTQQLDYITDTTHYLAITELKDVAAQVTGPLFTLPAGEVRAALSGEIREVSFRSYSDHPPELFANCTGLTRNCVASGAARTVLYLNTLPNRSRVEQNVKEGAFEVNVPILKDSPFAQDLNVNAAVRYTSYDTSGDYWSWKLGADWKLTDFIKFRAAVSRDIRAPNLFDIASATTIVPNNFTDVVGNNAAVTNIPGYNVPNPALTAEIGHTYTLGFVINPAPGLSFTVDYYNINVTNAIFTIQGFNTRVQEACQRFIATGGAPANALACQLQSRSPTLVGGAGVYSGAGITPITATYISNYNLGSIKTRGVDLELNYATRLWDRRVTLRALATYQPHLILNYGALGLLPASDDLAGFADGGTAANLPTPKWRGTIFAGVEPVDGVNIDASFRWRKSLGVNANQNWSYRVPAYGIVNLNVSWDVISDGAKRVQVFGNVSNLFNHAPPLLPGTGIPGGFGQWPIGDDWIGQYFTGGVRFRF